MDEIVHLPHPKASTSSYRGRIALILRENRALKSAIRAMRVSLQKNRQHESEQQAYRQKMQQMCQANEHLVLTTFSAEDSKAIAEALSERQTVFLSMLSHELRNPMAAIAIANDMLERISMANPAEARMIAIIRRQVNHLIRLSDDLLDVARISSGKISVQKELISLSDVFESAQETALPLLQKRMQQFHAQVPTSPLLIVGDLVRLSQLFLNLFANASKFSPIGSTISLTVDVHDAVVEVSVKDTGRGISIATQATIFDLFSQGANSQEHILSGGLGIGLTLVRTIAEMHSGSVTVKSEGEGHGSEFIVTLPRPVSLGANDQFFHQIDHTKRDYRP